MSDSIHILYVDDEPDLLEVGRHFLELSEEFTITGASGAEEAIRLLSVQEFDIIVSDYQMPGMDGIAFLKHLKKSGIITPFILLTGRGKEEVVIEALNNGAAFYLQKDFDLKTLFDDLSREIRHAVFQRRAEQEIQNLQKTTADIIDFLPDPTLAIDINGVVISWNQAMEEMTGITKEEMIGQGDYAYAVPFYSQRRPLLIDLFDLSYDDLRKHHPSVSRRGENLNAEIYAPALYDGKGAYVWATGRPLYDTGGTRIGAIESIRDITDRKQTELDLQRKNEELHAAYEEILATEDELRSNLDILTRQEHLVRLHQDRLVMAQEIGQTGCWEYDLQKDTIWGSAEGLRIFGFPPVAGDFPINDIETYIPERKRVHQALIDLISSGTAYNLEYGIDPADGSPQKIIHSVARLERNAMGDPIRVMGVIRDITTSKELENDLRRKNEELQVANKQISATEKELRANLTEITSQEQLIRESEKRFRSICENVPIGMFQSTPDGKFIYVNKALCAMLRYPSSEELIRVVNEQSIAEVLHESPEYRPVFTEKVEQESEAWNVFQTRYRHFDGTIFDAILTSSEHQDSVTDTSYIYGFVQDISEQKRSEQMVREKSAYLENLISIANVPIMVWDPSFHITRVNNAFEILVGRSAEDLIGTSLELLTPPDWAERLMRLIRTTQDGVRWETVEFDLLHRNGTVRTVLWNSATLYAADGHTPVSTIAQGRDITDERRLEREKDAALAQIQQNLAYLAILNDGIRNPLTIIVAYTDMVDDGPIVEAIIAQAQRIDEMVNQLDRRWIESEKVLNTIRKHYQIHSGRAEEQYSRSDSYPDTCQPGKSGDDLLPGTKPDVLIEEVQAQLYTILDSIDALVYVIDMQTYDILFINRQGRDRFGDITGGKCYTCLHHNQNEPCSFCTNGVLVNNFEPTGVYQWEFHDTRNGRWYDCRDRAIRWSDGRLVRLEIATDITRSKQVEESLRKSEGKYQELIDFANEAIIVAQDMYLKFVNPRMEELTGYQGETLLSHPFPTFIHPDDRELVIDRYQRRLRGEAAPSRYGFRMVRKDGFLTWVEISSVAIEWEGRPATLNFLIDISERKNTEEMLLQSEESLRGILSSVNESVYIHDLHGRFVEINAAAERMYGYSREFLIGKTPDLLTAPDKNDMAAANLAISKAFSGEPQVFEFWGQRSNGEIFPKEVSLTSGTYFGEPVVIAVAREVTERKQAEEALQDSERQFRDILSEMPNGVVIHHKGTIIYVNQNIVKATGFSEEELLGSLTLNYVAPNSMDLAKEILRIRENGCPVHESEIDMVHKSGSVLHVVIRTAEVVFNRIPCTLLILIDTTERNRAEEALKRSEEKYRSVLSAIPDVLCILDKDGVFLSCHTPDACLLFTLHDSVIGKHLYECIPPDIALEGMKALNNALEYGQLQIHEFLFVYSDEPRWFEMRILPSSPDEVLAIMRDITEKKRDQEALHESIQKLRLLTSLTRHDILNQISAVQLLQDLAIQVSDPEKVHYYITHAQEAGNQIEKMIGFTREYENFGMVSCDWHRVVPIIESAREEISLGTVTIDNMIPDDIEVYADPIIRKVFTTLMENAVRHGQDITTIRFTRHAEGHTLVITCSDDGIGIPSEDKELIFEHGYGKNTGIGLFLAREIISITGMSIKECSGSGEGAKFEIRVPSGKWRLC